MTTIQDIKAAAIRRLSARREKLQAAYDAAMAQPASYSISGSVSATNRKLETLRKEIDAIDAKIAMASGGDGIQRSYPNYSGN